MDADYEQEIAHKEVWVAPAEGPRAASSSCAATSTISSSTTSRPLRRRKGTGLGRALLAHAERRAAELKLSELRLLTHELMTDNRAFYTALGWTHLDPPVDEHQPRVYFRKAVG